MEFECHKCGSVCEVDGDFPKYYTWCLECNDYAKGFDGSDYAADIAAGFAEYTKEDSAENYKKARYKI